MFFMSDRSAHLAILSTSGDLVLFKVRLWYNRRIVAGDTRRLKPLRDQEKKYLQCPVGQDSINVLSSPGPYWDQQSMFTRTTPATGKYLHVDVEHVFGATLNRDWHYDGGKVVVAPLYYRVFVITSTNSGDHLSFFHGDNGSFIEDIHLQSDGNVVHLEPIHSSRGLVALATQRRVVFVDTGAFQLIPAVCEAPGRHTFTSLSVDPLRATIVYAGTSTGRVLVYKLHNLGPWRQRVKANEPDAHSPIMCTLADQLMPRRPTLSAFGQNMATVVQTLPGFLVFGVCDRLVLYQLSGSSEELLPTYLSELSLVESFKLELNEMNQSTPHPQILSLSAAKDLTVHSIGFAVMVLSPDDVHHVLIYNSRIPPPGTNFDLTWIRVPAMMICALVAMYYQKKGSGGRSTFNEADLAGLLGERGRFSNMRRRRM
ncbi:hypothetical protein PHMEG_0009688 [Phytophthora megakarya]|uniref:Cleavage/polyadenylation specificity factor A subunit N-terminal domain-containing protein n=1 Tax=Phytophthora megakarya TaxID=4795 RepID=A0A225WHN6_9STRA|nr:hypothetical protein PHMEG_0009688 [Phytophthora megakarya]